MEEYLPVPSDVAGLIGYEQEEIIQVYEDADDEPVLSIPDLPSTSKSPLPSTWEYIVLDERQDIICVKDEEALLMEMPGGEMMTVKITDNSGADSSIDVSQVPEAIALETVVTTPTVLLQQQEVMLQQDDPEQEHIRYPDGEPSIKDQRKREQDRQKKQELRRNPVFRELERKKARERMKRKRTDPLYREREREKDRRRREEVRKNNPAQRQKERERDRIYKRINRASGILDVSDEFFDIVGTVEINSQDTH